MTKYIIILILLLLPFRSFAESMEEAKQLTQAAEDGSKSATYLLGKLYAGLNNLIDPDYKKSEKWYRAALFNGDGRAAFALLDLHEKGKIKITNPSALGVVGLEAITSSADEGDSTALIALGNLIRAGRIKSKHPSQAIAIFEKLAETGNARAIYEMAISYAKGIGVEVDNAKAFKYFKQAAGRGYVPAIRQVAIFYVTGIAVDKDLKRAKKYYEDAAIKGDVLAVADLVNYHLIYEESEN